MIYSPKSLLEQESLNNSIDCVAQLIEDIRSLAITFALPQYKQKSHYRPLGFWLAAPKEPEAKKRYR